MALLISHWLQQRITFEPGNSIVYDEENNSSLLQLVLNFSDSKWLLRKLLFLFIMANYCHVILYGDNT